MNKIDTILFDLDGTLIDTNDIIIQSYQHAFSTHFKGVSLSKEDIIALIGPPLRTIFNRFTDQDDLVDKAIQTYLDYYTKHEKEIFTLYPHVLDVLKQLKKDGFKIGIVTSKFSKSAMPSVEHFELMPYFDTFIALEDVKIPKPDPEGVFLALKRLNATNAMMIGDNQSDLLAGKQAGILCAGVTWSIKGRDHLQEVAPDYMLESMLDLLEILKS